MTWEALIALRRPWIVAHRGYSARFPENTLAAFEGAIEYGADAIALDVTLTADRVPVVLHDDRVDRTTDGEGLVAYMTADRVAEFDAGSWFAPEFAGERIPTLESVLERIGGRIVLALELRSVAFEEEERDDTLEFQVLDLVRRHGLESSVILSTFEPRYFARVDRRDQSVPRLYLCDHDPCEMDAVAVCERLGVMAFGPDAELIGQKDILRLRAARLKVVPWTVNATADMQRFLAWGVDGLITDEVERLRDLLASKEAAVD